jgi:hypothetical protein
LGKNGEKFWTIFKSVFWNVSERFLLHDESIQKRFRTNFVVNLGQNVQKFWKTFWNLSDVILNRFDKKFREISETSRKYTFSKFRINFGAKFQKFVQKYFQNTLWKAFFKCLKFFLTSLTLFWKRFWDFHRLLECVSEEDSELTSCTFVTPCSTQIWVHSLKNGALAWKLRYQIALGLILIEVGLKF